MENSQRILSIWLEIQFNKCVLDKISSRKWVAHGNVNLNWSMFFFFKLSFRAALHWFMIFQPCCLHARCCGLRLNNSNRQMHNELNRAAILIGVVCWMSDIRTQIECNSTEMWWRLHLHCVHLWIMDWSVQN